MTGGARVSAFASARGDQLWPGIVLAAAGAVAFSGKAILAKLMYRHGVDAVTVVAWRMALALPMFLSLAVWASRGQAALTRRDWLAVWGLGFSGYYAASMLDFAGLQYISASLERLILYLGPTIVMVISVLWFKRHVSTRQWLAAAISYSGALVVFGHELTLQGGAVALGAALVFGSAVSYSVYLVASGEVVGRLGSMRLTGLASSAACVLCLLHFALFRPWDAAVVPAPVVALSALNALACTFAPVLMVMMAIERIGSAMTAQVGMIGPLSTIAMGVWLLGEPFTPWLLAGTVLVMSGVWLLARWR
ncbi:DMT family transporter [Ideonella sp. 4Y16]|uniref:DMT family transporter n=1 Tax=Ideonella alba TaxID=2824118 RepID=A0A940Y564_9BURK|nr:DMT family transporter [Ideonella alba]MBQ0929992.1 DMT family transporter [Ideonella alba]MBQ0945994.1 DMT family transporter [Ideonella alba]